MLNWLRARGYIQPCLFRRDDGLLYGRDPNGQRAWAINPKLHPVAKAAIRVYMSALKRIGSL